MTGPAPETVLAAVRAALVERYGPDPAEASVTFLGAPPLRVLRFVGGGGEREPGSGEPVDLVTYASLGCSAHPMGDPSALVPDPAAPRAELVVRLRGGVDGVLRPLAVLASTPAVEGVVLTEGAILDTGDPLWEGAAFTGVVLRRSDVPPVTPPSGSGTDSAPVDVWWAVPVTPTEAAWARVRGVDELVAAWNEAGIDVTDPGRRAAAPRSD